MSVQNNDSAPIAIVAIDPANDTPIISPSEEGDLITEPTNDNLPPNRKETSPALPHSVQNTTNILNNSMSSKNTEDEEKQIIVNMSMKPTDFEIKDAEESYTSKSNSINISPPPNPVHPPIQPLKGIIPLNEATPKIADHNLNDINNTIGKVDDNTLGDGDGIEIPLPPAKWDNYSAFADMDQTKGGPINTFNRVNTNGYIIDDDDIDEMYSLNDNHNIKEIHHNTPGNNDLHDVPKNNALKLHNSNSKLVGGENHDLVALEHGSIPTKVTFDKWLTNNKLSYLNDILIKLGFDNTKMFTKCTDSDIDALVRDIKELDPTLSESGLAMKLKFKTAIDELLAFESYWNEQQQQLTHEERRALNDIEEKINFTQATTEQFSTLFDDIDIQQTKLNNEVETKFGVIIEMLLQRKHAIINDIGTMLQKKKLILSGKIESLVRFQSTLTDYNSRAHAFLNNSIDSKSRNIRKDRILEIHSECNKKYMYTVEKTQIGIPEISIDVNTDPLLNILVDLGSVHEKINEKKCLIPKLQVVTNNGKDNNVRVQWNLTHNFCGIDEDLISSVRVEWLQIDDFKDDEWFKKNPHDSYDEKDIEQMVSEYIMGDSGNLNGPTPTKRKKSTAIKKFSSKVFILNKDDINNGLFSQGLISQIHIINTRRQGLFVVRLKLIGNHKDNFVHSSMQYIKIFRKEFNHIKDHWDANLKDKELKIGLFSNKKVLNRTNAGGWKNCFGSVSISSGVNVWTIKVKKKDNDRKFVSVMFGIAKDEKIKKINSKVKIDGCFAYGGNGNDGYGFYAANGCIYHKNKYGQQYIPGYQLQSNDIVCIIVDYYKGIISFDISPSNKKVKLPLTRMAYNIDKQINYRLAVSMRGCDEIQLIDV